MQFGEFAADADDPGGTEDLQHLIEEVADPVTGFVQHDGLVRGLEAFEEATAGGRFRRQEADEPEGVGRQS